MSRYLQVAGILLATLLAMAGCQPAEPTGTQSSPSVMFVPSKTLTEANILTVDQLRPGMRGYGLTVFAGAKPERFEVEILSVLRNYDPKADMILVRCSGQNLEKTGIAAGMSGSPVYIDGKLIGAVAYGWSFTVDPIAGVQPIKQMLCNSGLSCDLPPATQCDVPEWASGNRAMPGGGAINLADLFERRRGEDGPPRGRRSSDGDTVERSDWQRAGQFWRGTNSDHAQLRPLSIPLAVSGGSPGMMRFLQEHLADRGIVPVRSGGNGCADPRMADACIEPGSTVTIPMLTGDMDISALGTVTAVVNDRVLAFGHPMFAEGPVNLPMAVGVVHTFIPSIRSSFKMGSAGPVVGAVRRDENASILGVLGQKPAMSPITVRVNHWTGGPTREYRYEVVDEWFFTPLLSAVAAVYSSESEHGSPVETTLYYSGRIRFRGFEPFTFSGVGAGSWATSDMAYSIIGPISRMMNNPWGKAFVEAVEIDIRVVNENRAAFVERARLEQDVLLPGEPATIHLTMRRYKKPRLERTFTIDLPADLPDGTYQLALLDADGYRRLMTGHDPRTFRPENMAEMVRALNKLASPREDHFYVALSLPRGGLAGRDVRLPALPGSRAMILRQANRESYDQFTDNVVWPMPMEDMVIGGSRSFSITIDRNKGKK